MITLWELKGKGDRRYSLFSWRTRMALRHKGLAFESKPVAMSDKAAIAFSGGRTVPIIRDGDKVVRDSWAIAEYVEDRYPERPSLFGGAIGRGMAQALGNLRFTSLIIITAGFWAIQGQLYASMPDYVIRMAGETI